ncbi:MAG: hypothetical protein Q4D06_00945 [Coriobacteriia bacterium]|nr:hypothetical protein [Coriobacteriia bacterium]
MSVDKLRLRLFLESSLFDFVLVMVASVALTFTISYGFESAASLRGNWMLEAACTAPLLLAMFAGSWSKKALVPSAVVTVLLAVGIVVGFAMAMPAGTELFVDGMVNDVDQNYVVFALVVVVVPVAVYLLSRRRAGVVALLVLDVLACGTIQFLYRDWTAMGSGTAAFLISFFAVGMMMIYQTYRSSVYGAKRVKKTAFPAAFGFAALIAGVCVAVGALVFFGLINALGISTPNIKPFTDYYQRPVIEYSGAFSRQQVINPNKYTSTLTENEQQTNQEVPGGKQSQDSTAPTMDPLEGVAQALTSFDADEWAEQFQAIGYETVVLTSVSVVALIALLIAAIILARRWWRERRLQKIADLPVGNRIVYLYDFLMGRFHRLKICKPEQLTPMEWAMASRRTLMPFTKGTGGVDLLTLTLIYQRVIYGTGDVTERDYKRVERYYRQFFGNAREYTGKVKWLWKFWRI